jgi:hypothetical protein
MSDWRPTWSETSSIGRWTAPEGEEIMTKIDDERGERNMQPMMRRQNLWYINAGKPGEMYVYYTPTHWKPL